MNLKEGMKVKIQNLPGNRWDGVVCRVDKIEGEKAKLVPVKKFNQPYGYLDKESWERCLKIMNMSMVNK